MANRKLIIKEDVYNFYIENVKQHNTNDFVVLRNILKKFFNDNFYDIKKMSENIFLKTEIISEINLLNNNKIGKNFTIPNDDLKLLKDLQKKTGIHIVNILEILIYEFSKKDFVKQQREYLL